VIKIREEKENEPTITPSINNDQELEENATREEIEEENPLLLLNWE
jgi:hypothetical protein